MGRKLDKYKAAVALCECSLFDVAKGVEHVGVDEDGDPDYALAACYSYADSLAVNIQPKSYRHEWNLNKAKQRLKMLKELQKKEKTE